MTIFQKQYFKEIVLVTGGLWSTCDCPWGRRKKKAQLEKELEGLFYLDEEISVVCLQRGRRDWWYIYRLLIWVRKFNTQTALAWRRRCPIGYTGYRACVLLPHSPFSCAVSQQGQTAEPLQLAHYSHRATQLSHYTQNLILQIAVGWASSSLGWAF